MAFLTGVVQTNGIGWATAKALGEEGVSLGITDISGMVHERADELRKMGIDAVSFAGDLRDLNALRKVASEMVE